MAHFFPFVSICTPTFNRGPFIPFLIKCVEYQTYPKDRMEWIIIDDGSDKIKDVLDQNIKDITTMPQIKYFQYSKQMTLGKKRNIMHDKCTGSIIIYMDDDDYYPPERVSHAVEMLLSNPTALCAGSSEMHVYFDHVKKIYQCGPYGPNHSTAATFAFKKELLSLVRYDDKSAVAEEKHFLKNYTIPFVQLDTTKTIMVFAHIHNSVDKKPLIDNPNQYIKVSEKKIEDFIKNADLKSFYIDNMNSILEAYPLGKPSLKPEMMKQIDNLVEERKKLMGPLQEIHEQMQWQMQEMRASYENIVANKDYLISALIKQNKELKSEIALKNAQLCKSKSESGNFIENKV
jgi:glycosyltransferase involved in cell wall biosynthesis